MTRTKRIPDGAPVSGLTVGQLRAILAEAIDDIPAYGSEADSQALTGELLLRELRELGEDLQDDLDRVMTRLGLEPTDAGSDVS